MMRIILINGKAESGKDFVASSMKRYCSSLGKEAIIIKFGDLLKKYIDLLWGWDENKNEQGRELLQTTGEGFKNVLNDRKFWAKRLSEIVDYILSIEYIDFLIISDWRFPEEFEYITKKYKDTCEIYTVNVKRGNFENHLTESQKKHISENAIDGFQFDFVVEEEDKEKKEKEAINIIKGIM